MDGRPAARPAERLPDWTVQPERGGGAKLIITEGRLSNSNCPRCSWSFAAQPGMFQHSLHVYSAQCAGQAPLYCSEPMHVRSVELIARCNLWICRQSPDHKPVWSCHEVLHSPGLDQQAVLRHICDVHQIPARVSVFKEITKLLCKHAAQQSHRFSPNTNISSPALFSYAQHSTSPNSSRSVRNTSPHTSCQLMLRPLQTQLRPPLQNLF